MGTRKTQQERREGTIRRLLDATTEILIDDGYANTSIQRICTRADISQGGLFRHFPTREALIVAAAEDVGEKILASFQEGFKLGPVVDEDRLAFALRLVRSACRSRLNQAWYELAVAARTNETLRAALAPIGRRYYEKIAALAMELMPDLATQVGAPTFLAVVATIVAVFDGESVHRFIAHDDALEEGRFQVLLQLVTQVARTASQNGEAADLAAPARRRPRE